MWENRTADAGYDDRERWIGGSGLLKTAAGDVDVVASDWWLGTQDWPDWLRAIDWVGWTSLDGPMVSRAAIQLSLVAFGFFVQLTTCLWAASLARRVPPDFRQIQPGLVWPMMIPPINLVWPFFVYRPLSRGYVDWIKGLDGDPGEAETAETLGTVAAVLYAIPCTNIVGLLALTFWFWKMGRVVQYVEGLVEAGAVAHHVSPFEEGAVITPPSGVEPAAATSSDTPDETAPPYANGQQAPSSPAASDRSA